MLKKMHFQRKGTVQITVYVVKQRWAKPVATKLERRASFRRQQPRGGGSGYDRKAQLLLYSQQLRAAAACLDKASASHKPQPLQAKSKQVLRLASIHNPQPNKAKPPPHRLQITNSSSGQHHKSHDPGLHLQPSSSLNPHKKVEDKPWKVVEVEQKTGAAEAKKLPQPPATCFGDWKKVFFPFFCATKSGHPKKNKKKTKKKKKITVSLSRRMSAIMMSSRMEKERIGVIARFLAVIRRRR